MTRETHSICQRRGWRLHAAGNEQSHFHIVLSWLEFVEPASVVMQLKGALSHHLGQQFGPGQKWFSRGSSEKRVLDREHFNYLMTSDLPRHSGVFWKEGQPLP